MADSGGELKFPRLLWGDEQKKSRGFPNVTNSKQLKIKN